MSQSRTADRYGADLAITVYVTERGGDEMLKTAFVQLKRVDGGGNIKLEAPQLRDASYIRPVLDRSFVAAIDPQLRSVSLGTLAQFEPQIIGRRSPLSLDVSDWESSSSWLRRWLSCEVGPLSNPTHGVESLLRHYRPDPPVELTWVTGPNGERFAVDLNQDLPTDLLPARAWVVTTIDTP